MGGGGEGFTDISTAAHYSTEQAACLPDQPFPSINPYGASRMSGLALRAPQSAEADRFAHQGVSGGGEFVCALGAVSSCCVRGQQAAGQTGAGRV